MGRAQVDVVCGEVKAYIGDEVGKQEVLGYGFIRGDGQRERI